LFLLFAPGATLLWMFLRREGRLTRDRGSPLLNMALFRVPTFTAGVFFALVFFCSNTGIPLLMSLYYQDGLGFSALESGLGVTAFALGTVLGASVAGRLVSRIGRPLVVGAVSLFFLATLSISLVVHLSSGVTTPVEVILRLALPVFAVGIAGGAIVTPNQTLTLTNVDPRDGGAAGGVLQTAQRVGSATGQTVLGTLFFVAVSGFVTSTHEGTPAPEPARFATGLDIGLLGSLFFSAAALVLGIVDLRSKRHTH
jgi:MFS family permease